MGRRLHFDHLIRITDDAGIDRIFDLESHRRSKAWSDWRVRRWVRLAEGRAPNKDAGFVGIVFLFLSFGAFFIAMWLKIRPSPILFFAVIAMFVIVMLAPMSIRTRRIRNQEEIVAWVARFGFCAACAYDLSPILKIQDAPENEVVFCPECAAVWRTDRFVARDQLPLRVEAFWRHSLRSLAEYSARSTKRIKDDAGQRTSLMACPPNVYLRKHQELGESEARRWRVAARAARSRGRLKRAFYALFCILVLTALPAGFIFAFWMNAAYPAGTVLASHVWILMALFYGLFFTTALSPFALYLWRGRHGALGVDPDIARRAMLNQSICPTCSEDLLKFERDPNDGSVVCANCGCLWRLENKTGDDHN